MDTMFQWLVCLFTFCALGLALVISRIHVGVCSKGHTGKHECH